MLSARPIGRDERGFALVTSMILLAAMLMLGLALLAIVDTQSRASGAQREGDSAFNLADATLSSAAFALSRNWPTAASSAQPWTQAATCATQLISGGVTTTTDTTIAGKIQNLVAQASAARNGPQAATWTVKACDAGSEVTWSPAVLARAPYDATGKRTLTDPNNNQFTARRLWVRATATVNGATRAVASLVQVSDVPAFPADYGILAGKMDFINGLNATTDSVLGDKTALGTLTNALLGTTPMVTGKIGVRCGLLSNLCLDAVASTLTGIPLLTSTGISNGSVVQYGSPTAASVDSIRLLRERASANDGNNAYTSTVTDGSPCIPAGMTPTATSVIFIEKIGAGKGTCTIPAVPGRAIGTIVVGSGRVNVTSTQPASINVLTGVIYGLNNQDDRQTPVVTINQGTRIKGGVFVDGGGVVAVYPPNFSITSTVCASPLLGLLCVLTPVTQLLDAILNLIGVNQLLTLLLPQLSTYGPVVQYDAATVATQTVFGSSGVVQNTFRQVAP